MKKIFGVLTIAILIIGFTISSVQADDSDDSRQNRRGRDKSELRIGSKATSTVNFTCVGTAVAKREASLLASWQKFDDAVEASLKTRSTALASAWSLSDNKARKEAVKKAWQEDRSARKSAGSTLKNEKKSAWSTFKSEAKACGGSVGGEASQESEAGEKIEI